MVQDDRLLRGASDGASEQVRDIVIQDLIALEPDRIEVALSFEKTVYIGIGESGIPSEESWDVIEAVTSDNRFQNTPPVISTVNIAMTKKGSLHVSILIEAEERMITGACKVSVIERAFLLAIGWTD
jgi:hypothetical protein